MITGKLAAHGRKAWAVAAAGAALAMALGPVPAAAGAHPAAGAHTAAWAHAAASPPPGREWAAFAYYPPQHELVLFGGRHPGMVFGDTWTRTGATWTQQHPATAPSARTGAYRRSTTSPARRPEPGPAATWPLVRPEGALPNDCGQVREAEAGKRAESARTPGRPG